MPRAENKVSTGRQSARGERYERFELPMWGVVAFCVALIFAAIITVAGLWDWCRNIGATSKINLTSKWSPANETRPAILATVPKLQITPQLDWQKYRREQQSLLNSYGWVDKSHGIVRTPIDTAVRQIVEHGLPVWDGTNRNLSPLQLQWQRAGKSGGPES